ncbi:MAG: hypothetical protein M1570_12355 [Chloroflexi bacterium]|nr:hypothetical protein [Chloroflexota bacterium]
MTHSCWTIQDYTLRPCPRPGQEFRFAVSLHNHSCHSLENLGALNGVVKLWYMRPWKAILQWAFGLAHVHNLDYAEVEYNPPFAPEDVLHMEAVAAASIGLDAIHLGITDHDEYAGSLALRLSRPGDGHSIALGEELTLHFQGHLFHLGLTGFSADSISGTHAALQSAAREGRIDDLFELLRASRCLVVLNHPLIPWTNGSEIPAEALLKRYQWAIHALEFNGMRRLEENQGVLELAKRVGKPVVGGGDSHLLLASSVINGSRAASFDEFAAEVKDGRAVPLIKSDYFAPLRWKLFLRVLYFIGRYRQIARFRGEPVKQLLAHRIVLLDPVGHASRAFLGLISALRLAR